MSEQPRRIVLGITGASGAVYAVRLLQVLCRSEFEIHLSISPSGAAVIAQELGFTIDLREPNLSELVNFIPPWSQSKSSSSTSTPEPLDTPAPLDRVHYHRHDNFMTPIASGSFRTSAMVICPCSGSTLSGIARAAASNLIQRAAEVHLKEHRKLVLVPRETPLSVLQLENMHRIATAGGVILPAMPGWYHGVDSLDSIVDFVVSRILDQLDIDNSLMQRWGESAS